MREWRIPLLNVVATGRITYGGAFLVRKATKREMSRWASNDLVRDVVPHRVLPKVDAVLVCRLGPGFLNEQQLDQQLMVWFAAASLFASPSKLVDAAFVENWQKSPRDRAGEGHLIDTMIFPLSLPVAFAPSWRGPIGLKEGRRAVVLALRAFKAKRPYAPQFHFALSRWFYSLNRQRRTLEDAILDLVIGLESVFILQDERGDKEELLRERLSAFWFETEPRVSNNRRRSFKWKVHEAYKVRSRIAHGDILDEEELESARNFFDQVMRHLLHDFYRRIPEPV